MKWIIILILFLVLMAIFAYRFRRQIRLGLDMYRMFKQLKSQVKPPAQRIEKKAVQKPLVRCALCGTWVPETNAINLRSKIFYCSANCMENAAEKIQ